MATSQTITVPFAGASRVAQVYVPDVCAGVPSAAIVVFHGDGGTGAGMEAITGFNEEADGWHFVVIYPETAADPSASKGTEPGWNMKGADSDIAFVQAMIAQLMAAGTITDQVYVAGYSEGGGMALATALSTPLVRGCGMVAVELNADSLKHGNPAAGMPAVFIHGTADPVSPFAGGPNGTTGVVTYSAQQSAQALADMNGCLPTPTVNGDVQTWANAAGDVLVTFYTVPGGGHTWPGGGQIGSATLGPVMPTPNASDAIWTGLP